MSTYHDEEGTAFVTLDDGKVNALGSATLGQLNEDLDRAQHNAASSVILTGRPGMFSAGFDLAEVRSAPSAREHLRRALIDTALRLFEFPCPVVIACTGHALAAGAALLLSADRRVGLDGSFKLGFNEAAIGAAISPATVELARYRMPMPFFESLISGETFSPDGACAAGLLDTLVDDEARLRAKSRSVAAQLAAVRPEVFREMRLAARGAVIERIRLERSRL
jgi:enoyl-CoA hydratase